MKEKPQDESKSKTESKKNPLSLEELRRRGFLKKAAGTAGAALAATSGLAQAQQSDNEENSGEQYEIEATPENIQWGIFDPDRDPILEIESGDSVKFDCVLTSPDEEDHEQYLLDNGIPESDIYQPEVVIGNQVEPEGPHPVNGPVYINDADPGDILEVHIQDIEVTAPYGVSSAYPGGALPATDFPEIDSQVVPYNDAKDTALFTESVGVELDQDIEFPLDPFMGIMAVSPNPSTGPINTIAPSYFGGNMDLQRLNEGTTIYFPVNAEGALFWTGDGHAAQGDGEVSLTAIEASLSPTFEFTLHKNIPLDWPVAETDEHYIPMGFSEDLDSAMIHSIREAISILVHQEGLDPMDAYRLCSLNVDFNIAQVVDDMEIIDAAIPKSMFSDGGGDLNVEALSTYQF